MKVPNSRSIILSLRAWLDGDEGDRNANRLAEYVIEKAISGHFGFFKLLLDMVDGKPHRSAEDERTFEAGCVLAVIDDWAEAGMGKAA